MSEDNTNKINGTAPLQRLASLKPPRELTLGGVKPNKKVFTPNLNVARNKNKGPTTNSRDQTRDDKNRRDRNRKKDKNKFSNGPAVIKSTGVFSEGLGNADRHYSRTSYGRDTDSAPTLQKPTIRVKDFVKIDKELEEQKIRSAFGNGSHIEDDSMDFKDVVEKDAPIKLPMDDGGWSKSQAKPSPKIKEEVIVKQEPNEEPDCPLRPDVEQKPAVDVKKETLEDTDVVNLLKTDKPTLILLQLPDTLPGRGGSVEDDVPKRKNVASDQPSTSTGEGAPQKPVDNRCRLADLEEGRIGKLRVHRSGKVTLALGDTLFEVSMGTKASFYQEAVSVGVDESSRSANIVALGALENKLNLLPHWETMFKDLCT
ncbi:hypothetical protein K1T71_012028 [Dendrolimus kikuchii]|uniref:Uncharacterized protein n=1 Tax=Dendrolimus kikuchii TaxID=765133 RepID=A0ACC1CKC8_9NEOP|nr:hypothetical protein K1T71_012028 [Dendrolimus kikuchii]